MAQGKMKVKSKVPDSGKKKQSAKKGQSCTQRQNRPIKSKKAKFEESAKLKKIITKSVNKAAEQEIRNMSAGGSHKLSRAQEAVAKYNNATSAKK